MQFQTDLHIRLPNKHGCVALAAVLVGRSCRTSKALHECADHIGANHASHDNHDNHASHANHADAGT